MRILTHLAEQHVEDAAALWQRRRHACLSPRYHYLQLAEFDARLEAHMDALLIGGQTCWPLCEAALHWRQSGEFFVAAHIAARLAQPKLATILIDTADSDAGLLEAIADGFAWMPPDLQYRWFTTALSQHHAGLSSLCALALSHCHDHAGRHLETLSRTYPQLYWQAASRLRLPVVPGPMPVSSPMSAAQVLHWALQETSAEQATMLLQWLQHSPDCPLVVALAIGTRLDTETLLAALRGNPDNRMQQRLMLAAAGHGSPALLAPIYKQLRVPACHMTALLALHLLTGLDPEQDGLRQRPQDIDVDDDNEYEALWFDWSAASSDGVYQWLNQRISSWQRQHRLLAGAVDNPHTCLTVLTQGSQSQRLLASLRLALHQPRHPWFNCAARIEYQAGYLAALTNAAQPTTR